MHMHAYLSYKKHGSYLYYLVARYFGEFYGVSKVFKII